MPVDIEHDEKRLYDLDRPEVDWLLEFAMRFVPRTFEEAVDEYEAVTDASIDAFRAELATLGLLDAAVTEPAVDRLEFYLQSYEVPVDRENEGVLFGRCKIGCSRRPRRRVFYLGLDEGWTQSSPSSPVGRPKQEFERNIRQFQRLLQNGVDQYYLVQDTAGGTPVTPCLYFEELFDEEFDRFSDLDSLQHSRASRTTRDGFETEPLDVPRGSHRIQPVEPGTPTSTHLAIISSVDSSTTRTRTTSGRKPVPRFRGVLRLPSGHHHDRHTR